VLQRRLDARPGEERVPQRPVGCPRDDAVDRLAPQTRGLAGVVDLLLLALGARQEVRGLPGERRVLDPAGDAQRLTEIRFRLRPPACAQRELALEELRLRD